MDTEKVHEIWLQAAELVKDRVVSPTIFKALERGVGVVLDGDEFIVGFDTSDLPLAANLRSAQNHTIIEQCLKQVLNRPVRFKIIEGTTLADYQRYKKSIETIERQRMDAAERRNQERVVENAWDEISDQLSREYAQMPLRTLGQQKAAFIKRAFEIINEGVNRLNYSQESSELEKRCLARVFDKLAQITDVPVAMLAYEFFKLREEGKLK